MVERALAKTEAADRIENGFEHYIHRDGRARAATPQERVRRWRERRRPDALLADKKQKKFPSLTPKGLWVTTAVEAKFKAATAGSAVACARTQGDAIDVTAQSLICVKAKKRREPRSLSTEASGRQGVKARAGTAGRRSGDQFCPAADDFAGGGGLRVPGPQAMKGRTLLTVFVPDGEARQKTFNPQLWHQGGISILGTTGIVEPKKRAGACGYHRSGNTSAKGIGRRGTLLTPGNYGMEFLKDRPEFASMTPVQCSNYIGGLRFCSQQRIFKRSYWWGHIGKLVKLAGGIMNTHSRVADCRCELFAAHAALAGVSRDAIGRLMEAATTDACLEILDEEGKKKRSCRV